MFYLLFFNTAIKDRLFQRGNLEFGEANGLTSPNCWLGSTGIEPRIYQRCRFTKTHET